MDLITLAMAKAYSDSKGGYVEKPVLTFNGDTTGKTVITALEFNGNSVKFVKISDKPQDLTKLTKLMSTMIFEQEDGYTETTTDEVPIEMLIPGEFDGFTGVTLPESGGLYLVLSTPGHQGEYGDVYEAGVYGARTVQIESDGKYVSWVSRLEFAETIHPIDPKYLPDTVATKADILGAMEASY